MRLPELVEQNILAFQLRELRTEPLLRAVANLRRQRGLLRQQLAASPGDAATKRGLEENAAQLAAAEDGLAVSLGI